MSLQADFSKNAASPDRALNDEGETALHMAAKEGDLNVAIAAIAAKATVHILDKQKNTPLVYATENGDIGLMRLLLKADKKHIDHAGSLGTALNVAAKIGNLEAAATLLEAGADINAPDTEGVTPLMTATSNHQEEMALFLLRKKADVSLACARQENVLHRAAANDDAKILGVLFAFGAARVLQQVSKDKRLTPLHIAVAEGARNAASCLLDHGAFTHMPDAEGRTPLQAAAEKGDTRMARLLIEEGAADQNKIEAPSEYTAFQRAVLEKNLGSAKSLLQLGADPHQPDNSGRTPLHLAAWKGDLAMVKFLLEEIPAEPDFETSQQSHANALYEAVFYGHADVAKYLAEAPAAPLDRANSHANYPINAAIDRDNTALLEMLLENGISPNVRDKNGATPLLTAIAKGKIGAAEVLLLSDANPNFDNGDTTPLFAAIEAGNTAITKLLVDFGADVMARDNVNRMPIDIARGKSQISIVAILENAQKDYEIKKFSNKYQGFKPG